MACKKALITGGSFGIGEELAKKFARNGTDVVLVARTERKLLELKEQIESETSSRAYVYALDLLTADIKEFYNKVTAEHRIDVLVNNAGFGTVGPFHKLDTKREVDMIELNIRVLVELTSYFLKGWLKDGTRGTIVNISSLAAFFPIPYMATYSATKAFVLSFSEAIRREVEDHGIRVVTICPGVVRTEFQKRAGVPDELYRMQSYMDVTEVVELIWEAIRSGRSPYIPGIRNKIYGAVVSLLPKGFTAKAAKLFMKRFFHDE